MLDLPNLPNGENPIKMLLNTDTPQQCERVLKLANEFERAQRVRQRACEVFLEELKQARGTESEARAAAEYVDAAGAAENRFNDSIRDVLNTAIDDVLDELSEKSGGRLPDSQALRRIGSIETHPAVRDWMHGATDADEVHLACEMGLHGVARLRILDGEGGVLDTRYLLADDSLVEELPEDEGLLAAALDEYDNEPSDADGGPGPDSPVSGDSTIEGIDPDLVWDVDAAGARKIRDFDGNTE